jgi:hypothetical protein
MKRLAFFVSVLIVALMLFAVTAYGLDEPATDNSECFLCHGVGTSGALHKVDFTAGSVDYAKCKACHAQLPDLTLYYGDVYVPTHYHTLFEWCDNCHNGDDGFKFTVPVEASDVDALTMTPYGYFLSATSPAASPEALHAAHDGSGWVAGMFGSDYPQCLTCHATASCTACHAEPAHTGHGDTASCVAADCHALSATSQPDPAPSCVTCHGEHGDLDVVHDASVSADCVGCHGGPDVRDIHGASPEESCAVCHNATIDITGKTVACGDCHLAQSPVYPNHYPADLHLASAEAGCRCHSKDLYTEHDKYDVGCVECHTGFVDSFTTAWDKSCAACHPTKHGFQTGRTSSGMAGSGMSGSGGAGSR